MAFSTRLLLPILLLAVGVSSQAAFIDVKPVYQVGDTRTGPVTLSYTHDFDGSVWPIGQVRLTIEAEGVDADTTGLGEDDRVYFNGVYLGNLRQQPFYSPLFDLQAGPGVKGGNFTALTISQFMIDPALLQLGMNLVEVVVDPSNYIMELETSKLQVFSSVPEPSTWMMSAAGVALAAFLRKKRSGARLQ
jgi:hypothetical protein